jgi:hypothetical protein
MGIAPSIMVIANIICKGLLGVLMPKYDLTLGVLRYANTKGGTRNPKADTIPCIHKKADFCTSVLFVVIACMAAIDNPVILGNNDCTTTAEKAVNVKAISPNSVNCKTQGYSLQYRLNINEKLGQM